VHYWESVNDIRGQWAMDRTFEKQIDETEKNRLISGWQKAVSRARNWE